MGYDLRPGGSWSGDYLVLDMNTLNNANNINSLVPIKVKDIVVPEYFTFPMKECSPETADVASSDEQDDASISYDGA